MQLYEDEQVGCYDLLVFAYQIVKKLQKEWMATLDGRTRHSHGMADGQKVDINGMFSVGGCKMRYPGDVQNGTAAEIYNCRCTMCTVEPPEIMQGEDERMTYSEWVQTKEGQEATGGRYANKPLDNGSGSGIIGVGSENVTISSINTPIERQHTGKGNPNAVLFFDIELNNRQKKLLELLPDYDCRIVVPKSSINMADLAALTAKTNNEFAMFTKGNTRLIIRGDSVKVNINTEQAHKLSNEGYKWSGHTHPGANINCMLPSDGDKAILNCFSQKTSVIYNSKGQFATFEKE